MTNVVIQVYFALLCAVSTYLITFDIVSTISVVIVAGACGVAAGTPLAVLGAIGQAARLVAQSILVTVAKCVLGSHRQGWCTPRAACDS